MVALKDTTQNKNPPQAEQPWKLVPPQWPQPISLFQDVKSVITFNPNTFLSALHEIHGLVEVKKSTNLSMEQTTFAALLTCCTITAEDGAVLFKLFDIGCIPEPPQELVVWQANNKFLKLNILQARIPDQAADST